MTTENPGDTEWIVFFGEDWGRHPSTAQYLALELARGRQILWFNSFGLREPKLTPGDLVRIWEKLRDFVVSQFRRLDPESARQDLATENIHVVSPIALPWLRFGFVRLINRMIVGTLLKQEFRRHGIRNPLVISACPSTAVFMKDIVASRKVYYCADEHSELAGMDKPLVTMLEQKLLQDVDIVIATSKTLQETKSRLHSHVEYLPHGVDYELFHQAVNQQRIPDDLKGATRPMVGFVGLIGEHIDLSLIQDCAREMKDVNFVLIGPVEQDIKIPVADNIVYLGKKDRKDLVNYMAQFDVCINPYTQSERNKNANPTKIREYLAAGCPVVTVPQTEASAIKGEVHIAETAAQFSEAVSTLLEHRHEFVRQTISSTMETETWMERANQLIHLIYSVL